MNIESINEAAVIGAGAWGTTVASLLANKMSKVHLWAHEAEVVRTINSKHNNELFLPGIRLPEEVVATNSYQQALKSCKLVFWGIPIQYTRERIRDCSSFFQPDTILVNLSKGLEDGTCYRPSQILAQECPWIRTVGSLAGPNIATEIARGKFAQATLAMTNHWEVLGLDRLVSTENFLVELGPDIVALELASALKNVVAILAGVCDGLGLGINAKSAIISLGFEEMRVLGRAMGANPDFFVSPCALGDLIVTSFSSNSRNRMMGDCLGSGCTIEEARIKLGGRVAEGVVTSKVCCELSFKLGLQLPIMKTAHDVVAGHVQSKEGISRLLMAVLREA